MAGRTTGLTLGKFAPFHRGHQLVLETALSECDEVTCIVYDSREVTPIPLGVRAGWIRALHPQVRVIEARGGPSEVGETPAIQAAHERFVKEELGIRAVDPFYSSETYGGHMSRALGAADRRVDPDRRIVPVSGAAVRSDPFAHRRHLHPVVYRDLVTWWNSACIRRALHPVWLRCSSPEYSRYSGSSSPCHTGASPASVRRPSSTTGC